MPTRSQILRKEKVLSGLIETRQTILAKVSSLSDEQRDQVFLGIWSIKDLLAHLIGWDHTDLDAVKSVLDGHVPAFYELTIATGNPITPCWSVNIRRIRSKIYLHKQKTRRCN